MVASSQILFGTERQKCSDRPPRRADADLVQGLRARCDQQEDKHGKAEKAKPTRAARSHEFSHIEAPSRIVGPHLDAGNDGAKLSFALRGGTVDVGSMS
jgi:hypothetical protein